MKILSICHANICRSFMAQEFFKHLLPFTENFSRGLYAVPTYVVPQKVINSLRKHHISFTGHTATPLTSDDLQRADLIFCMEQPHEKYLLDRYPQYTDKIWLLTEFACDKRQDIEDPIGLESYAFEKVANHLYRLCQMAAERIEQQQLK